MAQAKPEEECAEFVSRSPEETVLLGKRLGELLEPGDVVALIGALGAGKTTLAKGIAGGAGVVDEDEVTSPSFVLLNEYRGRWPVYHADLYRLEAAEMDDLGFEEFIFGEGVSLLEWAEKIPGVLPAERIEAAISWLGPEERKVALTGKGAQAGKIRKLKNRWKKEE
jgi:tRNA threonylcarbamoyladenosine biosynthesis protein TsaE